MAEKGSGNVLLNAHSDLKRPRFPDHKVQAGAGKTDGNRAHNPCLQLKSIPIDDIFRDPLAMRIKAVQSVKNNQTISEETQSV